MADETRSGADPHARTDPRSHGLFAGRYVLQRELGRGGMGAVYLAFDVRMVRHVALKRIEARRGASEEMLVQRFHREVRALAASRHRGTPSIHEYEDTEAGPYFTMEVVAGERLRDLLVRERLGPIRALSLAIDLAAVLAHMHEMGVVHRDVKPGNILIEAGDRVRLIDFGACAFLPHFFLREGIEADRITETGVRWMTGDLDVVATPGYSAPEVLTRAEDADVRNDVYSVCAIAYEMATGRSLLDKEAQRVRTIRPEEFTPELAPLAEVLARGVAHDSFERHRSMTELVQALEVVRGQLGAGARGQGRARVGSLVRTAALAMGATAVLTLAWIGGEDAEAPVARVMGAEEEPAAAGLHRPTPIIPDVVAPVAEPAESPSVFVEPVPAGSDATKSTMEQIRRRAPRVPLDHASVAAAVRQVRGCQAAARPSRIHVTITDGRGTVTSVDLRRYSAADAVHACIGERVAALRFVREAAPVHRSIVVP